MGSTKVKIFDDSAQVAEAKPKAKAGRSLDEKKKQNKQSHSELVSESNTESQEILLRQLADQDDSEKEIAASDGHRTQDDKQEEEGAIAALVANTDTPPADKKKTKKPKKGQLKVRGKKYQAVMERIEKTKLYPLAEAIQLLKETSFTKFPATLEIHIGTSTKNVRGLVSLPFLAGKRVKILAFGANADKSGADLVGDDMKLDDIAKGRIDFEALIATPAWMPKLARVAKILGPRGLMPNPKSGTVTDNLEKAVSEIQSGKVEYKSEANNPILHLAIGKLTQDSEELSQNIKALYLGIGKSKIKKIVITSTMGPGIKVDIASM